MDNKAQMLLDEATLKDINISATSSNTSATVAVTNRTDILDEIIEAALAKPVTTLEIAAGLQPQRPSPQTKPSTQNQPDQSRTSTNSLSSSDMEEDDKAPGDQAETPS